MPLSQAIIFAGIVIWIYMSAWFLASLIVNRNDVADIAWGLGFVVASTACLIWAGNYTFTAVLATALVLIWGLRLSLHIGFRNIKKPEDFRYQAWRHSWGKWFVIRSYLQIFILQGLLMLITLLPVMIIIVHSSDGVPTLVICGAAIWLFGFLFETVGDRQLKEFVQDPSNKGHIMTSGLWKYTRHPNYFGEVTQWWAIGLIALPWSYGWLALIGPALLTYLILKVSGVPLLEEKYSDNPEYQAYKKRTSKLIPLPTRNN